MASRHRDSVHRHMSNMSAGARSVTSDKGLRVLALDGGGVRGLSMLLTLQELMKGLVQETPTPVAADELQPWKYFDLICGSGTGGLIALMLGRLRMSIKDCIFQYRLLTQEVFNNPKQGKDKEVFKLKRLHDAVQRLVKRFGPACDRAECLLDPYPGECRVFVCASTEGVNGKTRRLRTYKLPESDPPKIRVAEAACATMAHPAFFKPAKMQSPVGSEEEFLGDTLGCTNPSAQVLHEITDSLRLKLEDLNCLISLGTGTAPRGNLPVPDIWKSPFPSTMYPSVRELVNDAEVVHHEMLKRFKDLPDIYFRFDAPKGMENIAWGDWRHQSYIQGKVALYFGDSRVSDRADIANEIIRKKTERSDSAVSMQGMPWPNIKTSTTKMNDLPEVFATSPA